MAHKAGHNGDETLASLVKRYESVETEIAALKDDLKDLVAEAKDKGYEPAAFRGVIKELKTERSPRKVLLRESIDQLRGRLGALLDTPLGAAALDRAAA